MRFAFETMDLIKCHSQGGVLDNLLKKRTTLKTEGGKILHGLLSSSKFQYIDNK